MTFISTQYRTIRIKDVSGGFVADPDWVGDFDAAGARAMGSHTIEPSKTGIIHAISGYINANGDLIDPGVSKIDTEFILLGSSAPEGVAANAIYTYEALSLDPVSDVCQLTKQLPGTLLFTVRIVLATMVPASADKMFIAVNCG